MLVSRPWLCHSGPYDSTLQWKISFIREIATFQVRFNFLRQGSGIENSDRPVFRYSYGSTSICDHLSIEREDTIIQELEDVILESDPPQNGLQRGDIGTVVLVHQGDKGYEVEFTTLDGEKVAVVTLPASQVRPAHKREIAHARDLAGSTPLQVTIHSPFLCSVES